jgi:hypothetical protein
VDYYYWPWPPVEIVNHGSWWPFAGSALLFLGGLLGVYITNKGASGRHSIEMLAAQGRHEQQLAAMRAEGRADRNLQRANTFREEVANILAERWDTITAAGILADAVNEYVKAGEKGVPPAPRTHPLLDVRAQQLPQFRKVEHLVIRASLLTNDQEATSVLADIRDISDSWKRILMATSKGRDPYMEWSDLQDKVRDAFQRLEAVTQRIVTSESS